MSYKIIEDGENFKIKELDENGNSVKVLEEVFATHEEATKFILDLEGGTGENNEVKDGVDGETDPVSTGEQGVEVDSPLKKYKVTGEIHPVDQDTKEELEALEIDSIQEVPEILGKEWVEKGLAEEVVE